jgi:hypothetical protein
MDRQELHVPQIDLVTSTIRIQWLWVHPDPISQMSPTTSLGVVLMSQIGPLLCMLEQMTVFCTLLPRRQSLFLQVD